MLLATTLLLGLTKAYAGCSVHDHLCSYHALGTPTTSYNQNQDTSLVIFSAATQVGGGTNNTVDFDNHVLLPDQTIDLSTGQVSSTEPFVYSTTSYGANNPSAISEWNTADTQPRHVYPSQYRVDFNQLTATAKHTGDYNGGEKDNIPDATGCPNLGVGSPNCEAVIINKNVPTGTYSQKVQMFNFHELDDPSAEIVVGAYATGQGTIISQSHLPSGATTAAVNPADTTLTESGVVYQTINLSGDQAQSGQFDYAFYNRGFDPHASGTLSFDHKVYHDKGYQTYNKYDYKTNTVNTYRKKYYAYDTNRQTIDGATGGVNNQIVQYGKTYSNTKLVGSKVIPITNTALISANLATSLPAHHYGAQSAIKKPEIYQTTKVNYIKKEPLVNPFGMFTYYDFETEKVTFTDQKKYREFIINEANKAENLEVASVNNKFVENAETLINLPTRIKDAGDYAINKSIEDVKNTYDFAVGFGSQGLNNVRNFGRDLEFVAGSSLIEYTPLNHIIPEKNKQNFYLNYLEDKENLVYSPTTQGEKDGANTVNALKGGTKQFIKDSGELVNAAEFAGKYFVLDVLGGVTLGQFDEHIQNEKDQAYKRYQNTSNELDKGLAATSGAERLGANAYQIGSLAYGGKGAITALKNSPNTLRNIKNIAKIQKKIKITNDIYLPANASINKPLTIKEAKELTGKNKGLIFVYEGKWNVKNPKNFEIFEAGTAGAMSDIATSQKVVPALRYTNKNPKGYNFVKFDGFELNGKTLIDRKINLTTFKKQIDSLKRVSSAISQNTGFKVVYELPTKKAADRAKKILSDYNIKNINVRVAK